MQYVITILWQIVTMFILVAVGYLMFRCKKITAEGSKTLGNILIYLSLPCVIMNSFLVERTPERVQGLLLSMALGLVTILVSILVSRLVLHKNAIEVFAGAFSNPGFFGIPLILASLAEGSAFYAAGYIAFVNLGQWTYGTSLLQGSDREGNFLPKQKAAANPAAEALELGKRLLKAPFMAGILAGLFFFLTGIPMPGFLGKCVSNIAGLNTPIAMFTVGIYLAQTDILAIFRKPRLYLVSLVRMILVPAVCLLLLCPIPARFLQMKLALLIVSACPVGSNVAVYAQLHDSDYGYAVETVIISTLLSVVTMPALVGIATRLWIA